MALPYENTAAGEKALEDIRKTLRAFGCNKFGYFIDDDDRSVMIQFEYRGRQVSMRASVAGYAAMWLREHPHISRMRSTLAEHQKRATEVANVAVFSILRDQVKGSVAAVETGVLSFDAAFMGHLVLPNGRTVIEHAEQTRMLSAPKEA